MWEYWKLRGVRKLREERLMKIAKGQNRKLLVRSEADLRESVPSVSRYLLADFVLLRSLQQLVPAV